LGKQLAIRETKLIALYMLIGAATVLPLTSVAVLTTGGLAGLGTNHGAHGLTEILVAYSSSFANNGQTFASLNANTIFYNVTTAVAMLVGRFGLATLALALAGAFAEQGRRAQSSGILATDTPSFAMLLIATILLLAGLCYLPVLALGPIVEQLAMMG
jgi:K+-transporting ATPase ATPase A chain